MSEDFFPKEAIFTVSSTPRSTPFHLVPLSSSHFAQLHDVFDAVCREKRFLVFDNHAVVGWCDVHRQFAHARQHVVTLGMAVAASHRGRGIGRALITKAIGHTSALGISRIELTVHTQNTVAQAFYSSVGFVHEGTQERAWRIDGVYFNVHFMARLTEA